MVYVIDDFTGRAFPGVNVYTRTSSDTLQTNTDGLVSIDHFDNAKLCNLGYATTDNTFLFSISSTKIDGLGNSPVAGGRIAQTA